MPRRNVSTCAHELSLYLFKQSVVYYGNVHQQFHQRLVEQREHLGLHYLLDNQRNRHDQFGTHRGKRLKDNPRRGHSGKEVNVTTLYQRMQQLHYESVHVSKRKHAHYPIAGIKEGKTVDCKLDVAPQVVVGQHDAL